MKNIYKKVMPTYLSYDIEIKISKEYFNRQII